MIASKAVVRNCKVCGEDFLHTVKGSGRYPDYCPTHAAERPTKAVAKYRQTEKYRESVRRSQERKRETYDPWLWENTILEWDE